MVSRKAEIAQVHGRRIRPKLSESACYSVACNFCATQARARQFNVTLYVADPSQMRRGILLTLAGEPANRVGLCCGIKSVEPTRS